MRSLLVLLVVSAMDPAFGVEVHRSKEKYSIYTIHDEKAEPGQIISVWFETDYEIYDDCNSASIDVGSREISPEAGVRFSLDYFMDIRISMTEIFCPVLETPRKVHLKSRPINLSLHDGRDPIYTRLIVPEKVSLQFKIGE